MDDTRAKEKLCCLNETAMGGHKPKRMTGGDRMKDSEIASILKDRWSRAAKRRSRIGDRGALTNGKEEIDAFFEGSQWTERDGAAPEFHDGDDNCGTVTKIEYFIHGAIVGTLIGLAILFGVALTGAG